jgi:hypothetical protein
LAPPEGYFLLSGRQPFDTCGRDVEKILKAPVFFFTHLATRMATSSIAIPDKI